jgi:kynurenine/2-aminoadipate aminotransferase
LGGGNPNPATFPIESMSVTLKTGEILKITPQETQRALQYSPTVR